MDDGKISEHFIGMSELQSFFIALKSFMPYLFKLSFLARQVSIKRSPLRRSDVFSASQTADISLLDFAPPVSFGYYSFSFLLQSSAHVK